MLTVLVLAVVMSGILGAVLGYVAYSAKLEKRSDVRLEATYAAEYAFEKAYQELYTLITSDRVNLPTIAQITAVTNLTTAPTDVFTAANGYSWKSYLTVPIENGVIPIGGAHTNFDPTQGCYKFLTVVEFTKSVPTMNTPVHVQFQREWAYGLTSLFQYAIFYNSDMELFPGADFIVGGRVHSNGKIYTGSSAKITFQDYVTSVDTLSNSYSPLDPRAPGSPGSGSTHIVYAKDDPILSTREDPQGSMHIDTTDANVNNNGPRELIEIPNSAQTDDNAADRLYNDAGLKVLANTTASSYNSLSGVTVPANKRVFLTKDGTAIPATDPLAVYLNTMLANSTVKDYREGSASVTTTDIDVSKLTTGYAAGGLPQNIPSTAKWPNNATVPAALKNQNIPAGLQGKSLWNGVLYVADVTNSGGHRVGIKIINGSNLPDGTNASSPKAGLTIVSENAAYIVGDYNTGGSPPVNTGAVTASNAVAGYTVRPAAVIADAVTIVSSNWVSGNYNTTSNLSDRNPVNTTINCALISGIVASNGTDYSGGVENYLRLLEDWGGCRLTYYGSIINLYQSQQATARWRDTGNYYNAPTRNWYFDINFRDPNKLPLGTPILRNLRRGQWVQIN